MTLILFIMLTGCGLADLLELVDDEPTVERNCEERTAWYPDADGDGLGEGSDVYLGCEAPDGWVTNADDVDDTDSGNADSGNADSGNADSGNADPGDDAR